MHSFKGPGDVLSEWEERKKKRLDTNLSPGTLVHADSKRSPW
jgi:hypothetical protein